mmetsp:Transcript_18091/g.28321  ORF Transcript_18091/g.28321 Transcript_18091/m.28321 type:complete len:380 (-) Transcript_18091:113-1252(-)
MDCYGLLKIPATAKTSIIKKAYHTQCLMTHPDKNPHLEADNDEAFKRIVKAFNILGDADKRRAYDSIGPIDESVSPNDREYTEDDFFDVFRKHFDKVAVWSHKEPPQLGNNSTDFDAVDQFYDFWYEFQSWRDFSFAIEDVEIPPDISREERRYIYHECERKMSRLKKNEAKAIRSLVEKCRKCDPRIKRRAKQKQSERDALLLARKLSSTNITTRRYESSTRTEEAPKESNIATSHHREIQKLEKNEWIEEDIIELQKAITIFPPGTVGRWEKMSAFLKNKFSPDDVLLKTKELERHWTVVKDSSSKVSKGKPRTGINREGSSSQWSTEQQKMLEDGMRAYRSYNLDDKWFKISQMVRGKTEAECRERYKLLCNIHKR